MATTGILQGTPAADGRLAGVDNLLLGCAELKPGAKVLMINEAAFWIARPTIEFIARRARELGATVTQLWPARAAGPEAIPAELIAAIEAADVTLFNHTMGAMLRLRPIAGGGIRVLNYATTDEMLESEFCRVPYALWDKATGLLMKTLNQARQWRITCPLGTDIAGTIPADEGKGGGKLDVFAIRTFPIGTHRPTSSMEARGRIAVRWLTSASLHDFGSPGIKLTDLIHIDVDRGDITGFSGPAAAVDQAKRFLGEVGEKTSKKGLMINSWHAGTNPQTFSPWRDDTLETWMNVAHNSPRILHFHAVGSDIPGELSVPVIDPTVEFDGSRFWDRGSFCVLDRPEFRDLPRQWPGAEHAFEPNPAIGV